MSIAANELGRRENLRRFGYRLSTEAQRDSGAGLWDLLHSDFHFPSGRAPELDALSGPVRTAAEHYAAHLSELDDLMDACDAIHARILADGPEADLVEVYVEARDAYEDAVERFGELRRAVQERLDNAVN
ncbi:hypothetical protein [Sphingopyxis sp.]|uniref:hypothetical protein n=1 Tax=Sphingopyxis sp. TaxID=1908224 RepID=UPI003D6C85E5